MRGPCLTCDGKCGGLHDGDPRGTGNPSELCHCAGCQAERQRQGKRDDEMYSYGQWERDHPDAR